MNKRSQVIAEKLPLGCPYHLKIILSKFLSFYLQQTGLNALHLASKEGHLDVVRSLLAAGIPVNSTTKVRLKITFKN